MVSRVETKRSAGLAFQAKKSLAAPICLKFQTLNAASNIGQRNIESLEEVLDQLNIPIVAKHVGGSAGRNHMVVDLQDFKNHGSAS